VQQPHDTQQFNPKCNTSRCCQSIWSFFAGPHNALIFTAAAISPSCLPSSVSRAWESRWGSLAWGWERKEGGMELKKDASRSPSRAGLFSPPPLNAQQLFTKQNKQVDFPHTQYKNCASVGMPRQRIKGSITRDPLSSRRND